MYQLNYGGEIYCFDYETDIVEQLLIRHLNRFDFLIENVNDDSLKTEAFPYYGGDDEYRRGDCCIKRDDGEYFFYTLRERNRYSGKVDLKTAKWNILNNPNVGLGFIKTLQKELKENINNFSTIKKLIEYETTLVKRSDLEMGNLVYMYRHTSFLAKEIIEVKNINVNLPKEYY